MTVAYASGRLSRAVPCAFPHRDWLLASPSLPLSSSWDRHLSHLTASMLRASARVSCTDGTRCRTRHTPRSTAVVRAAPARVARAWGCRSAAGWTSASPRGRAARAPPHRPSRAKGQLRVYASSVASSDDLAGTSPLTLPPSPSATCRVPYGGATCAAKHAASPLWHAVELP